MTRWVHRRSPRLTALAGSLVLLAAACSSAAEVPTASPTLAASETPEATSTATPGSTATQTPTAASTSTVTPTSTVAPTPTPTPRFDDVVASTTFIPTADLDRVEFSGDGGPAALPIEVPPRSEYGIGLSGRYQLAGRGMLFYYPDGTRTGFWMRNTHIDLDIAFVDFNLRIIDILRMEADTDTIHRPEELYLAAIEAPAGWYEAAAIEAGDGVEFLFDVAAVLAAAGE